MRRSHPNKSNELLSEGIYSKGTSSLLFERFIGAYMALFESLLKYLFKMQGSGKGT